MLQIITAWVRIREEWCYTYVCLTCKNEAEYMLVVKAEKASSVIPGSFASPETIAQIMTQKFVMGSLLYRQKQEIERMSVHLSRQTVSNWILRAELGWLKPVYECMHRELVKWQMLYADETTLQILREPGESARTDRICAYTERAVIRTGALCSMSISRTQKRSSQRSSQRILPAICIRTGIRVNIPCWKGSEWLVTGRIHAAALTRCSKCCQLRCAIPRRFINDGHIAISCLPLRTN